MSAFEQFIDATVDIETTDALAQEFGRALASEGYENHIFTSVAVKDFGKVIWCDFPSGYPETYISENWQQVDPVLSRSLVASRPFEWNSIYKKDGLTQPQRDLMENCKLLGVHSGVVFPMYGLGPNKDVISISQRHKSETNPKRIPILHAICAQAWCKHLHLMRPADDFIELLPSLTPRECETLRWVKIGKSNDQISEILNISERTVQHHLTTVMQKLGVSNRVSAVVAALQRGLI